MKHVGVVIGLGFFLSTTALMCEMPTTPLDSDVPNTAARQAAVAVIGIGAGAENPDFMKWLQTEEGGKMAIRALQGSWSGFSKETQAEILRVLRPLAREEAVFSLTNSEPTVDESSR